MDAIALALEGPLAPVDPVAREDHRRALALAARQAPRENLAALAVAAIDAERNLEGVRLAIAALAADAQSVPAYLAGAVGLDRMGLRLEALAFYEQALERAPNNPTIAALLGACATRMGEHAIAEGCYRAAAKLEPSDWTHASNLGGALRDQGKFAAAIDILRNALYVHPEAADLWNTLGTVLQEQGETEQALVFLEEAVRLKPGFARALHNYGATLSDLGRFSEAAAALDGALGSARAPSDRAEMRHARAWARLGAGDLPGGWADYEARFDPYIQDGTEFQIAKPRWAGESLAGKRLLIVGEQGLGDEVLFLNAAGDALAAAAHVTIATDRRLVPLVQRSFPAAFARTHSTGRRDGRIVRFLADIDWDGIDLWAPMGDLARYFRADATAFPARHGFLAPDPARVAEIAAALDSRRLNIGIAWKSLVMTPKRARWFAPFESWAPVLATPGAAFYSLQYGETEAETAIARERFGVELRAIPGLDAKEDIEGVAAAGRALDLVIAPMNASSNLAAACGGEVWFLHRHATWTMLGRPDTPFYPGSRAFFAGDGQGWADVMANVAGALAGRIGAAAAAA